MQLGMCALGPGGVWSFKLVAFPLSEAHNTVPEKVMIESDLLIAECAMSLAGGGGTGAIQM